MWRFKRYLYALLFFVVPLFETLFLFSFACCFKRSFFQRFGMAQSLHQGCFSLVWRCCRAIFQQVENRWWIEGWRRRIRPVCHSKRQNVRSKAVRSIRTERDMPERFRRCLKHILRAAANAFFRGGSRRREKACRSGEKACSKRLFSVFAFGSFLST